MFVFAQKTVLAFNGLTILYDSGVEHVFEFVFSVMNLEFLSEGSSRVGWGSCNM